MFTDAKGAAALATAASAGAAAPLPEPEPLTPLHPGKLYHVTNTNRTGALFNNGIEFERISAAAIRTKEPVGMADASNFHGVPGFTVEVAGDAEGAAVTEDVDSLIAAAKAPLTAEIAELRAKLAAAEAGAEQAATKAVQAAKAAFLNGEQAQRESLLIEAAMGGHKLDRRMSLERLRGEWEARKGKPAGGAGGAAAGDGGPPPGTFGDE